MDEGGGLGRSTDFLQLLTKYDCIYMGTGKSGSYLNSIVKQHTGTKANSVRGKLRNAGLSDKFWCFATEDLNFKMHMMRIHLSQIYPTMYGQEEYQSFLTWRDGGHQKIMYVQSLFKMKIIWIAPPKKYTHINPYWSTTSWISSQTKIDFRYWPWRAHPYSFYSGWIRFSFSWH